MNRGRKLMAATNIQVVTGSDAFILTSSNTDQQVNISNPSGNEFRLTITIAFEEFRVLNECLSRAGLYAISFSPPLRYQQ